MRNAKFKAPPPPPEPRETVMERVKTAWEQKLRADSRYDEILASAVDRFPELRPPSSSRPLVKDIIRRVALRHGLPIGLIKGNRRSKHIVAARHEAIVEAALARPDMSLPELGRQFGGRDHTTILHALRKAGIYRNTKNFRPGTTGKDTHG
jgi:hypothetical protein